MKHQSIIEVKKDLADKLEGILAITEGDCPDYGRDSVIHVETATFSNGFQADIKLCNGNTPYVDPVLFDEKGNELCIDEVSDTFLGEYLFEYEGDMFEVILKVA